MYDKFKSLLKTIRQHCQKPGASKARGMETGGALTLHTKSRQSGGGAEQRLNTTANYQLHEKYTRPRLKLRANSKKMHKEKLLENAFVETKEMPKQRKTKKKKKIGKNQARKTKWDRA